jgi:hypothetical protein
MRKALSLATIALFVLGLVACNHNNDITGIDTGRTPYASTPTPTSSGSGLVMAPNQPAPKTHKTDGVTTLIPTPVCILRPAPNV